jgi:nitric oxide reductase large subunit
VFLSEGYVKKLWIVGAVVVVASFSVLGWIGGRIYQEMPPIPDRVITADGREVISAGEIARGQNVWQSLGGMQVGSIWGHGSYVAPDWTADWLHRELLAVFVAVAFWNMVGAGLFGFMINPPIALYYMQGLNTTPLHGHAALLGVYGMLGIGLMLVCLRVLFPDALWKERLLKFSFWSMNIGLLAMCIGSLLPVGLFQTWAAVDQGYWFARSPEFLSTPLMQTFRWMRVPGDTLFALGAIALVIFVATVRPRKRAVPVIQTRPVEVSGD